jgi:hypothetical protein
LVDISALNLEVEVTNDSHHGLLEGIAFLEWIPSGSHPFRGQMTVKWEHRDIERSVRLFLRVSIGIFQLHAG